MSLACRTPAGLSGHDLSVHDLSVPEPDESPPDVRRLEPAERDRALTTVVAAFESDPLLRWVWPEDGRYASCAPGFFGLLLDLRRAGGEVWAASGGAAVAMWDPPGGLYRHPAEDPWPALQETFTDGERARWVVYEELMGGRGPAPHWYLGVLATDPEQRRRGLAGAVVAPVLAAADRTGVPAYLETASAANVPFYARFGFAVEREVDLPDAGPRCWLLRRGPQAAA
jgi:GNAT superfamily N-acetyltransferase